MKNIKLIFFLSIAILLGFGISHQSFGAPAVFISTPATSTPSANFSFTVGTSTSLSAFGTTTLAIYGSTTIQTPVNTLHAIRVLNSASTSVFSVDTVNSLASTSNLTVSLLNAANCDVKSSTSGVFSCGTDVGAIDFNPLLAAGFIATSTTASSTFLNVSMLNATSTNATTTNFNITGTLDVDGLTSAIVLTGAGGVFAEYTGASCTNQFIRSLSALGVSTCATVVAGDVDLADLTATDSTLTFSGAYDGQTARTIGLNLTNANTWTASSTFPLLNFGHFTATSTVASSTLQNFIFTQGQGTGLSVTNLSIGALTNSAVITNANLVSSSLTVTAGTSLTSSGCSPVSLGGTCTHNVALIYNPFTAASFTATSTATSTIAVGFEANIIGTSRLFATSTAASSTVQNLHARNLQVNEVSMASTTATSSADFSNALNLRVPTSASSTCNQSGCLEIDTARRTLDFQSGATTYSLTSTSSITLAIASSTTGMNSPIINVPFNFSVQQVRSINFIQTSNGTTSVATTTGHDFQVWHGSLSSPTALFTTSRNTVSTSTFTLHTGTFNDNSIPLN